MRSAEMPLGVRGNVQDSVSAAEGFRVAAVGGQGLVLGGRVAGGAGGGRGGGYRRGPVALCSCTQRHARQTRLLAWVPELEILPTQII